MAKTPSLKASVRLVFTAPSFLRCSSFCPRSKAYTYRRSHYRNIGLMAGVFRIQPLFTALLRSDVSKTLLLLRLVGESPCTKTPARICFETT